MRVLRRMGPTLAPLQTAKLDRMPPLLIAHRGDTARSLENTTEAFGSAFERGADGVEFDVQIADDGTPIVVHDYGYDRTRTYPALDEVLSRFAGRGRLEIEAKTFGIAGVERIARILAPYEGADVELTSGILPLLPILREHVPWAATGMIFPTGLLADWMTSEFVRTFLLGHMALTGSDVLHLDLDHYTPELVGELHTRGWRGHAHVGEVGSGEFERACALGLDQVSFDRFPRG